MKYENLKELFNQERLGFLCEAEKVETEEIHTPYLVYLTEGEVPFSADGICYFAQIQIHMELITETIDSPEIEIIDRLLSENEIFYEKSSEYNESFKIQITTYTFWVTK